MSDTKRFSIKGLAFHESEGMTGPRFVCQLCDDLMDDAQAGVIIWKDADNEAIVVHKECQRPQEIYERYPLSMELHTALAYMLNNLGMDDKAVQDARATARSLSRL